MGTPFASRERRELGRDWIREAYVLSTEANIPDPLGLSVAEFDAMLSAVAQGAPRRSEPMDARAHVEAVMRGDR